MAAKNSAPVCHTRIVADVLIAEFDNPPVNAISQAVRDAVVEILETGAAQNVRAVLFCARGKTFFSGADIREFAQAQQVMDLPTTLAQMDQCPIPLIALMHGTILGGGLEFALRCDIRLAHTASRFGFPEVKLGLIPGAGGTQLLPRLVDVESAIEMICRGEMIDCATALKQGLIDEQIGKDEFELEHWIEEVLARIEDGSLDLGKRRLGQLKAHALDEDKRKQLHQQVCARARGQLSPLRAFEAVIGSSQLGIEQGLQREREIFLECKKSAQSKALRHIFFAEKSSAKSETTPLDAAKPSSLKACAVVGCGTMGAGIGAALLHAAENIILVDANQANLDKARQTVLSRLEKMRQRQQLSDDRYQHLSSNIKCTHELKDVSDADLVIEAVFEDLEVKRDVFDQLDKLVRSDAILATNTSYIDPRKIFANLSSTHRCLGLHFFSPADVMRLLEIVVLPDTDDETLLTAVALAKKIKKMAVLAKPEFGFVANNSYMAYGQAVQQLILTGNSPVDIDKAMTDFGMAMGPLAVLDMSGIDVGHRGRMHNPAPPDDPGFYLPASILVERGELGRKSGIGFYRYRDGKPCGVNEEALAIFASRAQEIGVERHICQPEEIVETILTALCVQCRNLLENGVCQRPSDMDVVWVNGYGFPRWRGGPMYWQEQASSGQD